jgi:hypothetical protein
MNIDISDVGGPYQIFVAEDNSSFSVRLISNDAVGTDFVPTIRAKHFNIEPHLYFC